MAYGDFEDLSRKLSVDKILHNKTFNIAKNSKYDGYQGGLVSVVYIFFDKKTSDGTVKNENISNKELAEELHKPIIRKSEKKKVHSPFIATIWGADLPDIQLIIKLNEGTRFLLCVIDFFNKCAGVISLKDKKSITITNAFQKISKESN